MRNSVYMHPVIPFTVNLQGLLVRQVFHFIDSLKRNEILQVNSHY
jgi:hypothetical protein